MEQLDVQEKKHPSGLVSPNHTIDRLVEVTRFDRRVARDILCTKLEVANLLHFFIDSEGVLHVNSNHPHLPKMRVAVVNAINEILGKTHPEVPDHQIQVGYLVKQTALALGLSEEEAEELGAAAMIHDAGKALFTSQMGDSSNPFSRGIQTTIKEQHPIAGARIIGNGFFNEPFARVAYEHHMNIDGSGYPKPPPGYEMSLGGRIAAPADRYTAMREPRLYRQRAPFSHEEALSLLAEDVGTKIDQRVFEAMCQAIN